MTAPALALIPVLTDHRTGTGASTRTLDDELLDRATRDDYEHWLGTAPGRRRMRPARSGCAAPSATSTPAPARSSHASTPTTPPDKVIYLPCGDRRASVCPPCAETYRADTYQLIRAGLAGGKGMPESVAVHPCVFATFTAPSFGPVHTRVVTTGGKVARCRPRRKASYCPHGRRISCGQRHKEDRRLPGQAAVPRLLRLQRRRRLERPRLRAVAPHHHHPAPPPRQARQSPRRPGPAVLRQSRRVPAPRPDPLPRHLPPRRHRPRPPRAHRPAAPGDHRRRARRPHPPGRPTDLVRHRLPPGQAERLGHHLGRPGRPARRPGSPTTARSPTSRSPRTWPSTPPRAPSPSASRPAGSPPTTPTIYADPRTHQGRLIAACLSSAATRTRTSRRCAAGRTCSATAATSPPRAAATPPPCAPCAPPAATGSAASTRPPHHHGDQTPSSPCTDLEWAGRGWRTTGDALLALSAAARAREHRRIAREESAAAS